MAYQSWEEKHLGREAPFGKLLREIGIMGAGTVAGMLRFPTTIRKSLNRQTRLQKDNYKKDIGKIFGAGIGYVAGICADVYALQYLSQEASRDNYLPAIALGATNLASFLFEFGRYSGIEKKLSKYEPNGEFGGPTEL
jgi:hypothetical protein